MRFRGYSPVASLALRNDLPLSIEARRVGGSGQAVVASISDKLDEYVTAGRGEGVLSQDLRQSRAPSVFLLDAGGM